tara:strand:+ start:331 stop:501 length:171 start_codon:yes stop_codon:yes gene_type:complete
MTVSNKDAQDFYKMLEKLKTKDQQANAQSDNIEMEEMDKEYANHCLNFFKGKKYNA